MINQKLIEPLINKSRLEKINKLYMYMFVSPDLPNLHWQCTTGDHGLIIIMKLEKHIFDHSYYFLCSCLTSAWDEL